MNQYLNLWFSILGEPMQVVDEAVTEKGIHFVWLRGPRHVYARQRDEIQEARALTDSASPEQVKAAAARYAEKLRKDLGLLSSWEGGEI